MKQKGSGKVDTKVQLLCWAVEDRENWTKCSYRNRPPQNTCPNCCAVKTQLENKRWVQVLEWCLCRKANVKHYCCDEGVLRLARHIWNDSLSETDSAQRLSRAIDTLHTIMVLDNTGIWWPKAGGDDEVLDNGESLNLQKRRLQRRIMAWTECLSCASFLFVLSVCILKCASNYSFINPFNRISLLFLKLS